MQQVGGYLGYTGRAANVIAKAALDPIQTWHPIWLIKVCGPGSLRLDSGGPDDFAPLFGFFHDEFSEVSR